MSFLYPWVLVGIAVPVLWVVFRWRRRERLEAAIAYPSVADLPASRGIRARARNLLPVLWPASSGRTPIPFRRADLEFPYRHSLPSNQADPADLAVAFLRDQRHGILRKAIVLTRTPNRPPLFFRGIRNTGQYVTIQINR